MICGIHSNFSPDAPAWSVDSSYGRESTKHQNRGRIRRDISGFLTSRNSISPLRPLGSYGAPFGALICRRVSFVRFTCAQWLLLKTLSIQGWPSGQIGPLRVQAGQVRALMATGDCKVRGVESSSSEPSCNLAQTRVRTCCAELWLAEDRRDRTASFAARRKTGLGVAPSALETYGAQLRALPRVAGRGTL